MRGQIGGKQQNEAVHENAISSYRRQHRLRQNMHPQDAMDARIAPRRNDRPAQGSANRRIAPQRLNLAENGAQRAGNWRQIHKNTRQNRLIGAYFLQIKNPDELRCFAKPEAAAPLWDCALGDLRCGLISFLFVWPARQECSANCRSNTSNGTPGASFAPRITSDVLTEATFSAGVRCSVKKV